MDLGYNIFEALRIKENPNATFHLIMFILFMILLAFIALFVINYPKYKLDMSDRELYSFLLNLKNFTSSQREIIESLVKKYDIKKPYKILINKALFDKYADKEIMIIEQRKFNLSEKENILSEYEKIKKKLFD